MVNSRIGSYVCTRRGLRLSVLVRQAGSRCWTRRRTGLSGVADVESLFGREDRQGGDREGEDLDFVVGSADNVVHGGEEFWEWVREMKGKARNGERTNGKEDDDEGGLEGMRQGRVDTIKELRAAWAEGGNSSTGSTWWMGWAMMNDRRGVSSWSF